MLSNLFLKINPAKRFDTAGSGAQEPSNEPGGAYTHYYSKLEIVQRGVNMLVDDASSIPMWVGDKIGGVTPVHTETIRKKKLETLLSYEPNPFQDISTFRRNIFTDLIMDGNIFLYFDGVHLYHLPASKVTIKSDPKTYVSKYTLGDITYSPREIIHIKENSFNSKVRGTSRLQSALGTMHKLQEMKQYQTDFFKNGAVPGMIIESPDALSQKIKDRLTASWTSKYNPRTGARNPLILDAGMKLSAIGDSNFKDMDFKESVVFEEERILKALGIPPVLLSGGNNANIRPNMRMYYVEAVLPMVQKVHKALERYFGYVVEEDLTNVMAMQPDLSEQASYFSTLTNGGIIAANESRKELGYDPIEGHDDLRIPANIAGSASNPSEGGRPPENNNATP